MGDNFVIIVCTCVMAGVAAYIISNQPTAPEPTQQIVLVPDAGESIKPIRFGGDLYPDGKYWKHCERKWRNNWSMRQFCEGQQEEAKIWAAKTVIHDDVARHCAGKWTDDWTMFKFCVSNEMTAKASVLKDRH